MYRHMHKGNIANDVILEEHEGALNAKRVYSVPKSVRIDKVSDTLTYIGHARVGALDSDPVWRVQKVEVNGTVTSVKFADGEGELFDQIWDDRASLTYI